MKADIGSFVRCVVVIWAVLATASRSCALTVLPGLSFTPSTNAPLAGVLNVATDAESRVSVSVDDGKKPWKRDFSDFGTNHSEVLLGFKADRTNAISVTVHDRQGGAFTVAEPLRFVTAPLPAIMPAFHLMTNNPEKMEPGYTIFRVGNLSVRKGYVTIVDNSGEVVWYSALPTSFDARQLTNGHLFFPLLNKPAFAEANLLGQIVKTWNAHYPVDYHEDCITDHGTFLFLEKLARPNGRFPSNIHDPKAPMVKTNASYYRLIELSATELDAFNILNVWPLGSMLDPARLDYLAFQIPEEGVDSEHANGIAEDPRDHSIIVSLRNQDAVVKFSRSKEIKWILGPHENWGPQWQPYLLKPVGDPFEWNYAQHAPVLTPQGTLLLFDNGNCRAEPFAPPVADEANYSRAVEYKIDETNMQVTQVWQFADTNKDRLYAPMLGNAMWLPHTSNVLVTFGFVSHENGAHPEAAATNATTVRIKEVTHEADPSVVFDLELSDRQNANTNSIGFWTYRSYRIPDLYGQDGAGARLDEDRHGFDSRSTQR